MYIHRRYEWDERKNRLNQRKHSGISFEVALLVLLTPIAYLGWTASTGQASSAGTRWVLHRSIPASATCC